MEDPYTVVIHDEQYRDVTIVTPEYWVSQHFDTPLSGTVELVSAQWSSGVLLWTEEQPNVR